MKKTLIQAAVAATLLGGASTAALAHGYDYDYYHRREVWEHRDAVRYPAPPAYGYAAPRYYGPAYVYPAQAYQPAPVYFDGPSSRTVAQVGGAAVGALVGGSIAHGSNRIAGAAIGAAVGALIGGQLAR